MMEKQVCSVVHEAYARQKGEFFLKKARALCHPITNFIPKGFNERAFPKEVQKSFRAPTPINHVNKLPPRKTKKQKKTIKFENGLKSAITVKSTGLGNTE